MTFRLHLVSFREIYVPIRMETQSLNIFVYFLRICGGRQLAGIVSQAEKF